MGGWRRRLALLGVSFNRCSARGYRMQFLQVLRLWRLRSGCTLLFAIQSFLDNFFNIAPGAGIQTPGVFDDVRRVIGLCWRQRERGGRKGRRFLAFNYHADNKVAVVHLHQVVGLELWREWFG